MMAAKREYHYIADNGNTVEVTEYTETITDGVEAKTELNSSVNEWRCYYRKDGEIIARGSGRSRKQAEENAWSDYQDWLSDNDS